MDLYAAFLQGDTLGERPRRPTRRRLGGALDLLPTVVIFLPIMLTWFGLFKATAAYRESRGDPALTGKSFLEQWQTGFNGRLGEPFYFDRIALWTLLAIGFLITVSLVQAVTRRSADRADEQERARLSRELASAIFAADFHLSLFRMDDASRVDHAARQLEDAADEARKAGAIAVDLQKQAHQSMEHAEKLAAALLKSDDTVRTAAERLADSAADIGKCLAQVAAAAADLSSSSTADSERLRKAVAEAAVELRSAADADRERLGDRIAAALDTSGSAIRTALDDWRTEGAMYSHRHETTADHLGLIVGRVEELMDRTSRALDTVATAVKAVEDQSERLLAGLPLAEDLTRALNEEFAGLREAVDRLQDGLGRVGGRRRWFR